MRFMWIARRARLLLIFGFAALAVLFLVLWFSNRVTVIHEKAAPDRFDLGTVVAGSNLEVSARLLTSANKHPFDVVFERLVRPMPSTWHAALWTWHPSRFRKKAPSVDLAALKPTLDLPPFVHLQTIEPDQRKDWYDNRPFFVLHLTVDASREGNYSG